MAARKGPKAPQDPASQDCDPADSYRLCSCRQAVQRAYSGMLASGAATSVALDAAIRVFRYHHPEFSAADAHNTVETWVFSGPLH